MPFYIGIDTSNYTTSVAVYDSEHNIVKQCKKLLPVKDGMLGLRQSDAVFHHVQQFFPLYHELVKNIDKSNIAAVSVSTRPRSIQNSYMPCFTVGIKNAKVISCTLDVPLYEFSHQQGHIAAALFSIDRLDLIKKPFIAFHVSGGTTEAILVTFDKENVLKTELVANTLDLNAGQVIDRVGVMLGLKFPCGKELEKLALSCNEKIKVKPALKDGNCCLSGVQNICKKMIENGESKEKTAAFCLKYIDEALAKMAEILLIKHGNIPLVFAGGVMSNSIIKNNMQNRFECLFAKPEFSTDNAAGIAVLAYLKSRGI